MAITYVDGDFSTSDNVTDITGLSWPSHPSGSLALLIWALFGTYTPTMDPAFTELDNDVDQNLRAILAARLPASMTGAESGNISLTASDLNRMSAALGIWSGVASIGTTVNYTEGSTATDVHPAAGNMTITPLQDSSRIVLVYSERSSTGNTAGTMTPPTHVGTGSPATIRQEHGTGSTGGTYVCLAEFQLGAGTAGVAQTFTQWNATPDTLIASNAEMWLVELRAAATDVTLSLGTGTEADTARALGLPKAPAFSFAAETGTAQPLSLSKTLTWGASAETGTPRPVAYAKTLQFGVATETGTASPWVHTKPLSLGAATESGQARALAMIPDIPALDVTVAIGPTRTSGSVGATRQSLTAGGTRGTAQAGVSATRLSANAGPTRRDRGA